MADDHATKAIAAFVSDRGIALTAIAGGTGIAYHAICDSLGKKTRTLRADEFLAVCRFIQQDPFRFMKKNARPGPGREGRRAEQTNG